MTDTLFCYHCRKHHPRSEMTLLVQARGVKRWRCRKSLAFGRNSAAERDAFGKAVSTANQWLATARRELPLPRPVLELLRHEVRHGEGPA